MASSIRIENSLINPPKAIHIRLSAEALATLLSHKSDVSKGKGPAIHLNETNSNAVSMTIGHITHPILSVREDQTHDIYKRNRQGVWQLRGRLTERLLLESDMSDRLKQKTETANAHKTDRHIVVLDTQPRAKQAIHKSHKNLNANSNSRNTSPRPSVSPIPTHRPSPLLTANHIPKRPLNTATAEVETLSDGPLVRQETTSSGSRPQVQEVSLPRQKDADDSLDSASSSNGASFNLSSGASASSRTSLSSGDSPPFKEPMHITLPASDPHAPPSISILTATPISEKGPDLEALGISIPPQPSHNTVDKSLATNGSAQNEVVSQSRESTPKPPQKKSPPTSHHFNAIAPPLPGAPASKRSRSDFESSAGTSSSDDRASKTSRPANKPHAAARTSGGARINKVIKESSPSTSPNPPARVSTPKPSALPSDKLLSVTPASSPLPGNAKLGSSKKRKSDVGVDSTPNKRQKSSTSRRNVDFTSSDESSSEAPLAASASRGRPAVTKPLVSAVANLVQQEPAGIVKTPLASRKSSPAPPSPKTTNLVIDSLATYQKEHARFHLLQQTFDEKYKKVAEARSAIQDLIAGKAVSNAVRMSIPSKKESERHSDDLVACRTELLALKTALWTFAKSQVKH